MWHITWLTKTFILYRLGLIIASRLRERKLTKLMSKAIRTWRWKAKRNIPCFSYLAVVVPSLHLLLGFLPHMLQAKKACYMLRIFLYWFIYIYYYLKRSQAGRQVGPLRTARKTLLCSLSNYINNDAVLTWANMS